MAQTSLIILLLVVIILSVVGGYWYYRRYVSPSPTPPRPFNPVFSKELRSDATIPKPPKPVLANFEGTKNNTAKPNSGINNGYPWCSPTWYSLRYVDPNTGHYGPLSDWMGPVNAGAKLTDLASSCISGACPFVADPKIGTCAFNVITIGTDQELPDQVNQFKLMINIHRQSGTFSSSNEGQIVGQILPTAQYGLKWGMEDVQAPLKTQVRRCPGC